MRTLNEDYPLFPAPQISSLQDMVRGSALRHGGKLALEDLNETPISRVTYQELKEKVVAFGQALRRIGLEERDHLTETSPTSRSTACASSGMTQPGSCCRAWRCASWTRTRRGAGRSWCAGHR